MNRQAGFSLIEMMVALTIMALAASVVVMTVGSPGGTLAAQTDRLISGLAAARDQALVENRMVSVEISETGFRTIVRSHVGPPALGRTESWDHGVSVTSPDGDLPMIVTFDPVGLADVASISLTKGNAGDGVVVEASGRIRRPHDAS